jgi:hypothetical protein
MPSSTSSFEIPAPERTIPTQRWPRVALVALLLALGGFVLWEWNARRLGYTPSYADTAGLWAMERRRVTESPDGMVAVGSSRTFFDLDLGVWKEMTGTPITQLAIVGTSPRRFLNDLAEDSTFRGLVLVGVTPGLFVIAGGFRARFLDDARKETPAQRLSQQLAMQLERRFAFLAKDDLPLFALLRHRRMPNRKGVDDPYLEVWRLETIGERRQAYMWEKLERDPRLLKHATMAWEDGMDERPPVTDAAIDSMLAANKAAVNRIRSRGGEVVYVRWPSGGRYVPHEQRIAPRERTWEPLLRETNAIGIHFEDYPELQGYELPEWSHLARREVPRFTRALVPIIRDRLCERGSPWAYRLGAPAGSCGSSPVSHGVEPNRGTSHPPR